MRSSRRRMLRLFAGESENNNKNVSFLFRSSRVVWSESSSSIINSEWNFLCAENEKKSRKSRKSWENLMYSLPILLLPAKLMNVFCRINTQTMKPITSGKRWELKQIYSLNFCRRLQICRFLFFHSAHQRDGNFNFKTASNETRKVENKS